MSLVVETSAVVATLMAELERDRFRDLLLRSRPVISAASLVELLRVVCARKRRASSPVWTFLELFSVEVVTLDLTQARLAKEGDRRFSKGRNRPPAVLNFSDLFAYALARHLDAPLLFKGDVFGRTDLRPAF